jgi:HSF-type DNA-binding
VSFSDASLLLLLATASHALRRRSCSFDFTFGFAICAPHFHFPHNGLGATNTGQSQVLMFIGLIVDKCNTPPRRSSNTAEMSNRVNELHHKRIIKSNPAPKLPNPEVNGQNSRTTQTNMRTSSESMCSDGVLLRDPASGRAPHDRPQNVPTQLPQNPALQMLSLQRHHFTVHQPCPRPSLQAEVSLIHPLSDQRIEPNVASVLKLCHEEPQPLLPSFSKKPVITETDESRACRAATSTQRQCGVYRQFFSQQLQDAVMAVSLPMSAPTFPQELYQMLRNLERTGEADVASFVANGPGFCIHKESEFARRIVPRYFSWMHHYSSFQQQLHLYGFARTRMGPSSVVYTHPAFIRCRPLLCTIMRRQQATVAKTISAKHDGKLKEEDGGDTA